MGVRVNNEETFPFDRNPKCWYLIVYVKGNRIHYETLPNSYSGSLTSLLCACRAVRKLELDKKGEALVFGIWHGKYNTDIFLLDPKRTISELERRGITCTKEVLEFWLEKLAQS